MAYIPINSGTGPKVLVDAVGTDNAEVIKIGIGASGVATPLVFGQTAMAASLPVVIASNQSTLTCSVVAFTPGGTQTVSVSNTPVVTATISNNPLIVTAANITVASITAGTVSISNTPVVTASQGGVWNVSTVSTVLTMPVLSATNVTIASVATIATGSVSVVNTPTVTASQGGTWNIATVSTVLAMPVLSASNVTVASVTTGTFAVSNILQYTANSTVMALTAQAMMVMGLQSGATTGRAMVISTTGGLIIDSMPAVGGGQQYSAGNTNMGATGTGTMFIGLQSGATTGRAIVVSTTGGLIIDSMPAVGGGQQYAVDSTAMGATATGTVIIGMQSGATTGRGFALTTTGALHSFIVGTPTITASQGGTWNIATVSTVLTMPVLSATNVTIASIAAGTVSTVLAMPVLSASNVTVASIAAGTISTVLAMPVLSATNITVASITAGTISTVLAMPVLSATNITVASITAGTISTVLAMPVLSATGVLLGATTAGVGAIVSTAHASNWSAYAVNTTSGSATIIKTSGAHTLYITDLMLSVNVPGTLSLFSAATTKLVAYLATQGGLVIDLRSPLVLNSNQSLTFQHSVSGSCSAFAAGYTVT